LTSNKVIEEKFASIIDAVCYWLGYQLKIGREQLIHEASLRYPIADAITAQGTSINRVVLEKLHPLFESKKIDLVIFDKSVKVPEAETDDAKLKEVFEFKLSKSDTAKFRSLEHQRVFDDVVRLAYYNMWGKKDCYFLMCGKYEDFKTFFVGQQSSITKSAGKNKVATRQARTQNMLDSSFSNGWEPGGLYKEWFDFTIGKSKTIKFEIDKINNGDKWGLRTFQNNYQPRDENAHKFSNTIEVKTTCLAITSPGEINRTHAAGIWKIESES